EAAHHLKGFVKSLAPAQGPLGRTLNGGAVCHGIRERHAELDKVGPRLWQTLQDFQRRGGVRVASRDKGDERLFLRLPEACKSLRYALHRNRSILSLFGQNAG